jgi:hypothetical protein
MKLKQLPFLFLLLLVSSWLDDAWVTARTDDSPAVQDNEYVHTPSTSRQPTGRSLQQPPGRLALPVATAPGTGPARNLPPGAQSAALFAVPLLYLLMSLRW